jgi:ATP-dependent Clp protease ATP-binding subunit ClpB
VLADPSASDTDGHLTAEAQREVLERTQAYLPPELLNRLDQVLVFNKLSRQSILSVVELRLKDISDRLKPRRITLDADAGAKSWLAERGYSDTYGARAIAREVRSRVLFPLAQKLLAGTIRDGDVVRIRVVDDKIVVLENHSPDSDVVANGTSVEPLDPIEA